MPSTMMDDFPLTTGHKRQLALLQCDDAAGDGNIQHARAYSSDLLSNRA